jgi:ABC-2 type transport system ATP-binding protein
VLVSSHVLSEMQQLVDHVIIIDIGRLVYSGTLAEVPARHRPVVVVRSPESVKLAAALARVAVNGEPRVEPTGPDRIRVIGAEPAMVGRVALAERIELHELAAERADLEQLFLELTGRHDDRPADLLDEVC